MGSTTTNLSLYKPAIGETGWGDEVNANFDTIDGIPLTSVRYAHPSGDDANDGLTWGTAKQYIMSAYDALPSTGGEVRIFKGTACQSTSNYGIWIVGPNDSQYASPPAGFAQQKAVRFVGVGTNTVSESFFEGPTAYINGGSGTDTDYPQVWLTGTNCGLMFQDIAFQYPAQVLKIGLDSSDGATSTNTSGITFRNCRMVPNSVATAGPTVESGYSYWVYFDKCILSGSSYAYTLTASTITSGTTARFTIGTHRLAVGDTIYVKGVTPSGYNGLWTVTAVDTTTVDADIGTSPTDGTVFGTLRPTDSDMRAAVLFDPPGTVAGLWQFHDCEFASGGIRSDYIGTLYMKGTVFEGNFVDPNPYLFYASAVTRATSGPFTFIDCQVADAPGGHDELVKIVWATSQDIPAPTDILTMLNSGTADADGVLNLSRAKPSRHQVGFSAERVIARQDTSRRNFGPVVPRYTNLATHSTGSWTTTGTSPTLTTSITAPDGTTNAARLTAGAVSLHSARVALGIIPWALGDALLVGLWLRAYDLDNGFYGYTGATSLFAVSLSGGTPPRWSTGTDYSQWRAGDADLPGTDGEWHWISMLETVTTAGSGGPFTTMLDVYADSDHPVEIFAPLVYRVPSGDMTDGELQEFARHMSTHPPTAPVGSATLLAGQKLLAPGGIGVGNDAAATSLGSVVKKIEVFDETGASLGFLPVYDAIT